MQACRLRLGISGACYNVLITFVFTACTHQLTILSFKCGLIQLPFLANELIFMCGATFYYIYFSLFEPLALQFLKPCSSIL